MKKSPREKHSKTVQQLQEGGPTWRPSPLLMLMILLSLVTFVIYLPALNNEFLVNWDEDIYILDNLHIRSLNLDFFRWAFLDYKTNLWHPVTWISHALDYAIWGLKPFGHHLTSILFHSVNTGIVVLLVHRLIQVADRGPSASVTISSKSSESALAASAVTGLLFAIHPLHVESVVWITERKDLLYSLFYLLSMNIYISYATDNPVGGSGRNPLRNHSYQASLLLCLLSLASKPMAVTLPVILLLLDWYPLHRLKQKKDIFPLLLEKLPYFVLSICVSIITVAAQQDVGGMKTITEAPPLFRLFLAMKSLMFYAVKFVLPVNLLPLYSYPKDISYFKAEYLLAALFIALISAICITFKSKRLLLTVWLYFIVSLIPVLGLLQAGVQAMADRFVYLPMLGPCLLVGVGFSLFWSRREASRQVWTGTKVCITTLAVVTALSLSWLTYKQIGIWKNAVILWGYLIEKSNGKDPALYVRRASALERSGQLDKALDDYAKALSIDPKLEWAYFNRGMHFLHRDIFERAIEDFSSVITLNPGDADAYSNRANAYLRKGDAAAAVKDLTMAITKKPDSFPYFVNRGNAYSATGQLDNAVNDFTKALAINPDLPNILVTRGTLNMKNGRFEEGMRDFKAACDKGLQEGCRKAMFPF